MKKRRRSIRLRDYDYSRPGAYFVTACVENRECLFGEVAAGEMRLNDAGRMVVEEWMALSTRFPFVMLDVFVVMPNHLHGIIVITTPDVGAGLVPAPGDAGWAGDEATTRAGATTRVAPTTLGDIVGAFKSRTTVLYARGVKRFGWPRFRGRFWQRNYYEHIIRSETSLQRIREYIIQNPLRWHLDFENPKRIGRDGTWDDLMADAR